MEITFKIVVPKHIYQEGEVVGDVAGQVTEDGGRVVFAELINTKRLDKSKPFEHGRRTFRIVQIDSQTSIMGGPGETKMDVLEGVVCEVVP